MAQSLQLRKFPQSSCLLVR